MSAERVPSTSIGQRELPSRLTLFAFLWACQALVHQEFYSGWLMQHDPAGWVLTAFALATLLRPSSLWLFAGMLASSVVYNVIKWPFVVNHILVESLINLTILAALGVTALKFRRDPARDAARFREQAYDRFAPVVMTMLVIMYYFAFVAKLNWDFVNPDVSCVVVMYHDLLRRFPFLPAAEVAGRGVIASTLLVEVAIPLLLTFRHTRYLGVLLGVVFHVTLGLVGHRTFSALAFALYALFCMDELVVFTARARDWLDWRLSAGTRRTIAIAAGVACVVGVSVLIASQLTGNYKSGIGPLKFFRAAWMIWIAWSLLLGSIFAACAWRYYRSTSAPSRATMARPGLLWMLLSLVVLNGMSQYLGLKTETCFTMYSNLRTEGPFNNHMFLPAIRLVGHQDDLVQIIATDIPALEEVAETDEVITYFELRRIVSSTSGDFNLVYVRNGVQEKLQRSAGEAPNSELLQPHSLWLAKLLYFRPVSTAECAPCQH